MAKIHRKNCHSCTIAKDLADCTCCSAVMWPTQSKLRPFAVLVSRLVCIFECFEYFDIRTNIPVFELALIRIQIIESFEVFKFNKQGYSLKSHCNKVTSAPKITSLHLKIRYVYLLHCICDKSIIHLLRYN